jgi:hypothetical protein
VTDELRHYRRWFYAAAIYNAVWGCAVVLFPGTLLRIADMNATGALPLVQVMGMMVGVYAYGYYLLAREPKRYGGLIWIALAGKTLGPLGFVYNASTGALPWSSAGSACSTTSSGGRSSGDSRSSTHASPPLLASGEFRGRTRYIAPPALAYPLRVKHRR